MFITDAVPRRPVYAVAGIRMKAHARRLGLLLALIASMQMVPAVEAEASFSASPSTISVPEGPGSIQGMGASFDISSNTGLASYGFSFPVAPGPGNFSPAVSMSYSSGAPNGMLGVGWSMGEARICRSTDAGFPVYGPMNQSDAYVIQGTAGQGQLVAVPEWPVTGADSHWYGLREVEAWVRARPDAESGDGQGWVVERPDGVVAYYGTSEGTREGGRPESFGTTYCWTLEREVNSLRRTIDYFYLRDGGRLYLSRIQYGDETSRPKSIEFEYEARGDVLGDWRAGFLREYRLRLKRVASYAGNGPRRLLAEMEMKYEEHWNSSRLTEARLIGEHGELLPPHTFEYGRYVVDDFEVREIRGPGILPSAGGYHLVDVDGDSFPDIVRANLAGWAYYKNLQGLGFEESPRSVRGAPTFVGTSSDWVFFDLDGDGLRDIVFRAGSDGSLRGYRNVSSRDGASAEFSYIGELGVSTPVPLSDPRMRLLDLNLDRRIDILLAQSNGELSSSLSMVRRDHDGVVRSSSEVQWGELLDVASRQRTIETPRMVSSLDLSASGLTIVDMNGDGLDDAVRFFGGAQQITSARVYPSRGSGQFDEGYELVELPLDLRAVAPHTVQMLDVNRDGLGDAVVVGRSEVRIWLNRGGRRFEDSHVVPLPARSMNSEVYLEDIDADGGVDVIVIEPGRDVWTVLDLWGASKNGGLLVRAQNGMGGVQELEYVSLNKASAMAAEAGTPWNSWVPVSIRVAYRATMSNSLDWEAITTRVYRDPTWDRDEGIFRGFRAATVTQEAADAAATRVKDFVFYTGLGRESRDFGEFFGRPQGNFGAADIKSLSGRVRSVVHRTLDGLLLSQELSQYELRQLSSHRDYVLPKETLIFQPEGAIRAPMPGEVTGEWGYWSASPRLEEHNERQRWLRRLVLEHDDFGNVSSKRELGFIAMDGSEISGDERVTETRYIHSVRPWRVNASMEETLKDGAGNVLASSRMYYDGEAYKGLPFGQISSGVLTRTSAWNDREKKWVDVVRFDSDRWGNTVGILDALGHYASIRYDAETNTYPVEESLYLGRGEYGFRKNPAAPEKLSVVAKYDVDRGLPVSVTDFNGATTRIIYDGLGRERDRVLPGDSESLPSVHYTYEFGERLSYLHVAARERSGENSVVERRTYIDGLGRVRVTLEGGDENIHSATGYVTYDSMGEPSIEYHDFDVTGWGYPSVVPSDVSFVRQEYDALGRANLTTLEEGSTSRAKFLPGQIWRYDPNDTDVNSPHYDTPTIHEFDGLGREVSTRLLLDKYGTERRYRAEWDARDLLVARELPDSSVRKWKYDSFGRRTSVSDPNAGTSWREYDAVGNVVAQINATGEYVHTEYDAVGRVTGVFHSDDAGGQREKVASYRYDVEVSSNYATGYGLGRLVSREEKSFNTYLDYDARGQLVRTYRELDGKVYRQASSFDALGRLSELTYSDGSRSKFSYDRRGRIRAISDIIYDVEYEENGVVNTVRYANGVIREQHHDERMQVREYRIVSRSSGSLLELSMDYDAAGVPLRVDDTLDPEGALSQSREWDYDALYRPTAMRTPSLGTVEYRFNEANNLSSRRLVPSAGTLDHGLNVKPLNVGAYQFGGSTVEGLTAGPHQVSRVSDRELGYDPNGQLVQDRRIAVGGLQQTERQFYWDPSGRLTSVEVSDGRRYLYAYDGGFVRTERRHVTAEGETLERAVYLSPVEELEWTGSTFRYKKVVYLGAERVAEVQGALDPGIDLHEFGAKTGLSDTSEGMTVRSIPRLEDMRAQKFVVQYGNCLYRIMEVMAVLGLAILASLFAAIVLRRKKPRGEASRVRRFVSATASLTLALSGLPACGDDDVGPPPSPPMIDANAALIYFHAPMLGTPVIQTDRYGNVYNRQVSTPYGVRTAHEGAGGDEFLFTGKLWDSDLDIIYFGARYYDAELGTWLSVDPMALWGDDGSFSIFDLNGVAYVGGRVTLFLDVFGFKGARIEKMDSQVREGIYRAVSAAVETGERELAVYHDDISWLIHFRDAALRAGFDGGNIHLIDINDGRSRSVNLGDYIDGMLSKSAAADRNRAVVNGVARAALHGSVAIFLLATAPASGTVLTVVVILSASSVGGGVMQAVTGDLADSRSLIANGTMRLTRDAFGASEANAAMFAEVTGWVEWIVGGAVSGASLDMKQAFSFVDFAHAKYGTIVLDYYVFPAIDESLKRD